MSVVIWLLKHPVAWLVNHSHTLTHTHTHTHTSFGNPVLYPVLIDDPIKKSSGTNI